MTRLPNLKLAVQGAAVLLPVAFLAGMGLYSLRADRAMVRQQAQETAGIVAPELARRIGARSSEILSGRLPAPQGIISSGQVVSPRDDSGAPVPPAWPASLEPRAARLWAAYQEAWFGRRDAEAGRRTLAQLSELPLGPEARANAEFSALLLEPAGSGVPGLAARAMTLARKNHGVRTESGAPLHAVALLFALRHGGRELPAGFLQELGWSVETAPSFMTPELLNAAREIARDAGDRAEIAALDAAWLARRRTIAALQDALRKGLPAERPSEVWVEADTGGEQWLALSKPGRGEARVLLAPAGEIERAFREARAGAVVPPYAGLAVAIKDRRWGESEARIQEAETLAAAQGVVNIAGPRPFTLYLTLTSPELLYNSHRRRVWITAGFIVCAALTALAGLAIFWRGYRRELLLSEMKSNFVSSVSHELRAPVAAVRLMAESLERGKIDGEAKQREYFRTIAHECRRLSALVDNVLDFSRIDQGRKRYRFEPVAIGPLARQAVALMEPCAAERQAKLVLSVAAGVEKLEPRWDGGAVEQCLLNLLDNAIKHAPPLTQVMLVVETPGPVRFHVADRGPGIPREAQERIFELFYRDGPELRPETKGAGIGLAIVKHVVEAHGGRVTVESRVGEGSRFTLELPLVPPSEAE